MTDSRFSPDSSEFDLKGSATETELPRLDSGFRAHTGELGLDADGLSFLPHRSVPRSARDTRRRRGAALADVVSLIGAYLVMMPLARPGATLRDHGALLLAVPLWILLNKLLGLYDHQAIVLGRSSLDDFPRIAQSIAIGSGTAYLIGPAIFGGDIGRKELIVFWLAATVLMPLLRSLARITIDRRSSPERCVILGSGVVAGMVARKIAAHREYGAQVIGFVDGAHFKTVAGLPRLGDLDDFEAICDRTDAERVIVAFSSLSQGDLIDIIRISTRRRMKISIVPRLFEIVGHGVEIDQIEGLALMGLRGSTRTRTSLLIKRAIDVVGATIGLVLTAPLMLVLAALIKLTSPGPAMFTQSRVGRGSQVFQIHKFRTMVLGADEMKAALEHLNVHEPMFKLIDDPRITRIGRYLRRTSLDELPQLWNVLRGEMSLVGPRPLIPTESARVLGWHRARLDLTPGLTGPWQVLGRNAIPFDEMVKLDYLYVTDWSLWNDVKLLLRTPSVVLGRGNH